MWLNGLLLLTFIFSSTSEDFCVPVFLPLGCDIKTTGLLNATKTWTDMDEECGRMYPGFRILQKRFINLTAEEKKFCNGAEQIPLGVKKEGKDLVWISGKNVSQEPVTDIYTATLKPDSSQGIVGSLNPSTGQWQLVDDNFTFSCALCEMTLRYDITAALHPPMPQIESSFNIFDVSIQLTSNKSTPEIIQLFAKKLRIDKKYVTASYYDATRPDVLHLQVNLVDAPYTDDAMTPFTYYDGQVLVLKGSGKVTDIHVIDHCPTNTCSVQGERMPVTWPETGANVVATVVSGNLTAARECYWDRYKVVWSEATMWRSEPCYFHSDHQNLREYAIKYQNKINDEMFNTLEDFVVLTEFISSSATSESLGDILKAADHLILNSAMVPEDIKPSLLPEVRMTIGGMIVLSESVSAESPRISIFVANSEDDNPVIGMNISSDPVTGMMATLPIHLADQNYVTEKTDIAVVVPDSLLVRYNHFATTYTKQDGLYVKGKLNRFVSDNPVVMVILSTSFTDQLNAPLGPDAYVEIAFPLTSAYSNQPRACAAMNDAINDFDATLCTTQKETMGSLTVCKCPLVLGNSSIDVGDKAFGEFIIYTPADSFQTFIRDNTLLYGIMVLEMFLSSIGILSIVVTAVVFKKWRNDLGHQILLHMVLALLLNLVFGFFNNFKHYDLKSAACLAIGIIRHYSYLAMFAWLFVMSALQLKRLLTVLGSKDTERLLVKVAIFAWGLPLIPIIILTAWNKGFYMTDLRNRGFCYPEGLSFELTVQAPAAIVLIANVVIFVLITARIYNCCGWGVTEGMGRHGLSTRKEQLRKLGTSLFIFFLFGLTWTFHLLSEEKIINNLFIFEYLFLITATTHVFMLALFFIFLDKETKALWQQVAADRIPSYAAKLAAKKRLKQSKKVNSMRASTAGPKFKSKRRAMGSMKKVETATV